MIGVYLLLLFAVILTSSANEKDLYYVVDSGYVPKNLNYITSGIPKASNFQNSYKYNPYEEDRVKIQLYYECLCPDCREFDNKQFKQTVIELGPFLDVNLYPYGNARTVDHKGQVVFICQHGPEECYGNKLHACAIDYLKNMTIAVLYNSCMMDGDRTGRGSDDKAADWCGQAMNIDSGPIKQCANSHRGTELLKYYGEESKKANFNAVPHILINGLENSGENFKRDVCSAFRSPPPACSLLL